MLNSMPLNSGPLNSLPTSGAAPAEVIAPGAGFVWRWAVTLGGEDVSHLLTGPVQIDSAENGDKVATLALWLGDDPVTIRDYTGLTLLLDFVVLGETEVVSRRFTGFLVQPEFDVLTRVLSCTATTRLSDSIEAMEIEAIDVLVGGSWSADVFEELAGRSRWDYAQERLSTRTASLNVTRQGSPRITPWHPASIAYEFAPGSTVYQSLDVSLATLSDTANVIELEIDYRYSRYRQRSQSYTWRNPLTGGNMSLLGFNAWRADSTELPDIPMVLDAVESAGWFVTSATWYRLPGDLPDLPQPWFNKNTDLLLGFDIGASLRWSQRAVEAYRLRLEVPAAVERVGEVIRRERIVLDTNTDADPLWESTRFGVATEAGDDPVDQLPRRSQDRLDAAANTALAIQRAELLAAHRGNRVSWQVPLAHALGVDIGQGVRLLDGATATGCVVDLSEVADVGSGAALLTITLAVSDGTAGQVSDVLTLPAAPEFVDVFAPGVTPSLPSQIGLRADSPPYDPELPGFAGSYSIGNGDPALRYPRRMQIDTPEIPAQWRDEITAERTAVYAVAPPVDEMEV